MKFRNLNLSTQLGTGLAAVVGVFVLSLLAVTALVAQLKQGVAQVSRLEMPMVVAVDRMNLSRSEVQQFLTDVSATHETGGYAEAEASVKNFREAAQTVRGILTTRGDHTGLEEISAIEQRFEAFNQVGKLMAAAYLSDGMEAGNRLMKGSPGQPGFDQASSDVMELLDKFRDRQLGSAQATADGNLEFADRIQQSLLWGGLLATGVAVVFGWFILRAIVAQIGGEPRVAVRLMQKVGAGDLSAQIRLRPGDGDSLMAHLQRMVESLHQVVHTVRSQAQGVAVASEQMAAGNQQLSERTAAQASSLEETAASMEQLHGTVQQSAEGAHRVSAQARAASESANEGSELVAQFVDTMQGVEASSRQIADIISLIDGIAFQTNILALNAAVEAARAGEQGRGFAVVASEVRSLAGRSAEAAKAITGLIGSSVSRVTQASALVAQARASMTEVQSNIRSVSQSMEQITTVTAEQSAGIAVVASAVGQMDETTQRNAALVEESAAAAAALQRQAQALARAVAVFKLAGGAQDRVAQPA